MLRTLTLAISLFAALIPLGASAAPTIPRGINLHNGYIEVRNDVVVTNYGHVEPVGAHIVMKNAAFMQHNAQEFRIVDTGTTGYLNVCCVLAGSLYHVQMTLLGMPVVAMVRPQLCSVRGIPFGFAIVAFTGVAHRDRNNNWVINITPHVPHTPCPVDPS